MKHLILVIAIVLASSATSQAQVPTLRMRNLQVDGTATFAGSASVAGVLTVSSCVGCGGGTGGGITNVAPSQTIMMSDGANAVASPLTYDGSSIVSMLTKGLTIGTSGGSPVLEPLNVVGTITSNSGGTVDFNIDPNGVSFIDSVVGATCAHGSGTDETFAIGWFPSCSIGMLGSLDVRTNGNTINNKDSGASYINATDTVNTGASPRASYGLQLINASGRGTGTGALTTYGLSVDNPGNGQTNYGIYVVRGGLTINAGGLNVLAGLSSFLATTTTTLGATAITATSVQTTGNIISTGGSIGATTINANNLQFFGGATNNDLYVPSAANQILNIDSSGTGAVNINTNTDGIANAGTGGLTIGPGNNSSLLGSVFPGTGQIEDRGTKPTPTGCGVSPVISGGAYSGRIITDTGATTCVLTFVASLHGSESCIVIDDAGGSTPAISHTSAALSITATATHTYEYDCRGH